MEKEKCIYEKWGVYFRQGCTDQCMSEHTYGDWKVCPKCGKEIEFYVEPEDYNDQIPIIHEGTISGEWIAEIGFDNGEYFRLVGTSKMDVTLKWNKLAFELHHL